MKQWRNFNKRHNLRSHILITWLYCPQCMAFISYSRYTATRECARTLRGKRYALSVNRCCIKEHKSHLLLESVPSGGLTVHPSSSCFYELQQLVTCGTCVDVFCVILVTWEKREKRDWWTVTVNICPARNQYGDDWWGHWGLTWLVVVVDLDHGRLQVLHLELLDEV